MAACDVDNLVGKNDGGVVWCYPCLSGNDCDEAHACDSLTVIPFCGLCATGFADCGSKACTLSDQLCHDRCDAGACPSGEICDTLDLVGNGSNICYGCLTALDCPSGDACNGDTHNCGACQGPTAAGAPSDCPPDAVCSNYWRGRRAVPVCRIATACRAPRTARCAAPTLH